MNASDLVRAVHNMAGLQERIDSLHGALAQMSEEIHVLRHLVARGIELSLDGASPQRSLGSLEFRVTSQFGDDGIIRELVKGIPSERQRFIEFGVQDYSESNTRFLLESRNWSGLVIDGDSDAMARLRQHSIYWRHNFTSIGAFVTRDNINNLFSQNGFAGDVGLLSIDIDGNDYWIWEAVDCIEPDVVVVEFNSLWGPHHAVSIPYNRDFVASRAHYSRQYWGASLAALEHLAGTKGYRLVGCNSAGNNAYFLKANFREEWPAIPAGRAYVKAKWRDSRDSEGRLSFASHEASLAMLGGLELVDVRTQQTHKIKDLWNMK